MANYDTLKLTFDDPIPNVATITFSRPDALNALNPQMVDDLSLAISELEIKKDEIRSLIVTGEGRAFVAGADIKKMVEMSPPVARNFLYSAQQALNRLEALPFPVIAKINGFALGGGLEISLACDIRIASDKSLLGLPEVGLGIIPAAGGTQRLTKIVGQGISKYLILTGKRLQAEDALKYGIVSEVIPHEELDERVEKLVTEMQNLGPVALAAAKRSIEVALVEPLISGLEIELNNAVECFQTTDLREGMNAFIEKRTPNYKGK